MAISHEARKKLETIIVRHYEGDLLTTPALNDIIAVFDGETNVGVQKSETFTKNEQQQDNELRMQIATRLLVGVLGSERGLELQQVEDLPKAVIIGRAKERVKIALLHADCLIEMVGAK
jgi:hypothetical protein